MAWLSPFPDVIIRKVFRSIGDRIYYLHKHLFGSSSHAGQRTSVHCCPGDSQNLDIGPLKDIVILKVSDGSQFPVGPDLMPLPWDGPVSCLGFPTKRKGRYREILGEVQDKEETDGWLNFLPTNVDEKAELGGMSGGPVRHKHIDGICGMLSGLV